MTNILRITTEFSESEDRFKLTALSEQNSTYVFWLTQRLLIKLIEHCFKWLENKSAAPIETKKEDDFRLAAVQEFNQDSAEQELNHQDAVLPMIDSPNFVIQEIDITLGSDGIIFVFKEGRDNYRLMLNHTQLRQWLHINCKLWSKAEWPMTIWPTWISSDEHESNEINSAIH